MVIYPLIIIPMLRLLNNAWIVDLPEERSNGTFGFITDHLDVEYLEPYAFQVTCPFLVILLHILFYLFTYWSIRFNIFVLYDKADEKTATHVAFYPKKHKGAPGIVNISRDEIISAVFLHKKYEYVNGQFKSLRFPIGKKASEYINHKGLTSEEVDNSMKYFGPNIYDIPLPTFMELFKEHILSPLFVFQIFALSTWTIDEYFMYPLITLVSILTTEANTVKTRLTNLYRLRDVKTEERYLTVKRNHVKKNISPRDLLPGDLVFLSGKPMESPADLLLLTGRVVVNEAMLTGESMPQVKSPIGEFDKDNIITMNNKNNIIFGGTSIEQVISQDTIDGNVICYVLSTGLHSSQGKLIRTILHSSERVTPESRDSLLLISFLTLFAFIASIYVYIKGIESTTISKFRLFVEIIKILTSTIPPDLPVQMSISVNYSLLSLSKINIFCTEPFRIPYAGSISVCCFDKTGTLTSEKYELIGVDEMRQDTPEVVGSNGVVGNMLIEPQKFDIHTHLILGGCHSLVSAPGGKLVGDSLEETAFKKLNFSFVLSTQEHKRTSSVNIANNKVKMYIERTFHFSSELSRMTCIVRPIHGLSGPYSVMKGAPNVVAKFLHEIPEAYNETLSKYTSQGCRVLALAYKELSGVDLASLNRESAETDMKFAGFVIFSSPFKKGTEDTVNKLLNSEHRVVIITGDDPLTACHVGSRLNILNDKANIANDLNQLTDQTNCVTGNLVESIKDPDQLTHVCMSCNIFARMSPSAKGLVVETIKKTGLKVLVCGDGTNDVSALKKADCGVGLLESSVKTKIDEDEYQPQLGAASIASPFVSKRSTVSAVVDLIRYGRASLTLSNDLFKCLCLDCILAAFLQSVLWLENVKFGDKQLTLFSLTFVIATFAKSMARPIKSLDKKRPFPTQFNMYIVSSVLSQFGLHLILIYIARKFVFDTGFITPKFDYKIVFKPTLMNTAMFIITSQASLTTFMVNYRGEPFMESFFKNFSLTASIVLSQCVLFLLIIFPLDFFDFVPIADDLKVKLLVLCIIDIIGCFILEHFFLHLFTFIEGSNTKNLVSEETLEKSRKYVYKHDDDLPDEEYKLSFIDMLYQSFKDQQNMLERARSQSKAGMNAKKNKKNKK